MAVKDRYGNNIRKNGRVTDLRPDSRSRQGTAASTYGAQVNVEWDDGISEDVRATDLRGESTGFRR